MSARDEEAAAAERIRVHYAKVDSLQPPPDPSGAPLFFNPPRISANRPQHLTAERVAELKAKFARDPADPSNNDNPKDAIGVTKASLSLFPDTARMLGALAFAEGAAKYGRYNWRIAGVRASVYVDALNRHMSLWFNGEERDGDTGLSHLASALACVAILIDAQAVGKLKDDRPPRAPVRGVLDMAAAMTQALARKFPRPARQYTHEDDQPQVRRNPFTADGGPMVRDGEPPVIGAGYPTGIARPSPYDAGASHFGSGRRSAPPEHSYKVR